MNIVASTANKVMELEKRLDNEMGKDSLRVTELKRDFGVILMDEFAEYEVATFEGEKESNNVVLQGEIRVRVLAACNIRVTLILDGYVIYERVGTYEIDVHSINILRAITIAPETSQKLVLRLERRGGGAAELATYNFFVWGYGENFGLDENAAEPRLSGASDGTNYSLFLVSNSIGYACYLSEFPESIDLDEFYDFGGAKAVAPVFLDFNEVNAETGETETRTGPIQFVVSKDGTLVMVSGEIPAGFDAALFQTIDSGVSAVTATRVASENRAVVVYARGGEIKYFTYDGVTRSEAITIYTFNEKVIDVALIQNCESTTFLAVAIESGKNYLFSSVTQVASSVKSSKITAKLSIKVQ